MTTYNVEDLVRVAALKALAQRVNAKFATGAALTGVSDRVTALENVGSQANVLETIKVNGTEQTITDKAVDITMPTQVSDLTNDSGFQTASDVSTAIQTAIAGKGTASFQKANAVPTAAEAEDNILYLVMNATTGYYDIYAKIDNSVVRLDDTTVDLTDYVTDTSLATTLDDYVEKETGKGLSTNDYTTAEQTKLSGITAEATKVEASETNGNIKINGTEVTVFSQSVATDAQITEMLDEVFGAAA